MSVWSGFRWINNFNDLPNENKYEDEWPEQEIELID